MSERNVNEPLPQGASMDAIDAPVAIDASVETADHDGPVTDADAALAKKIATRVEAILMSVDRPITAGRIGEALDLESTGPVRAAIDSLNAFYDRNGRSFRIEHLAGGYQILTRAEYRDDVAALHKTKVDNKLSPAAMETLAIIAYKQPILRAQVEAIRGVACGEVLRSLMDRHLVKITGRAEELGRPMLYGTTRTFLETFGLATLKDLPKSEELARP